jgi:uncharacterized glyoxalase superfamily protein PhnB
MSETSLFMVSLMVPDMDDAIAHYTVDWGFKLVNDSKHVSGHRWVEIAPDKGARLRLVEAQNKEQFAVIGRQVGDRVAFFLYLADFEKAARQLVERGIEVIEPIRIESYGKVIVFKDKYGNRWDALDRVAAV